MTDTGLLNEWIESQKSAKSAASELQQVRVEENGKPKFMPPPEQPTPEAKARKKKEEPTTANVDNVLASVTKLCEEVLKEVHNDSVSVVKVVSQRLEEMYKANLQTREEVFQMNKKLDLVLEMLRTNQVTPASNGNAVESQEAQNPVVKTDYTDAIRLTLECMEYARDNWANGNPNYSLPYKAGIVRNLETNGIKILDEEEFRVVLKNDPRLAYKESSDSFWFK